MKRKPKTWEETLDALGWNPADFAVPCHEIEVPMPVEFGEVHAWAYAPIEKLTEAIVTERPTWPMSPEGALNATARALYEVRNEPARVVALMFRVLHHSEADYSLRPNGDYQDFLTLAAKAAPHTGWHRRTHTLLPRPIKAPFIEEKTEFNGAEILPVLAHALKENLTKFPLVRISSKPGYEAEYKVRQHQKRVREAYENLQRWVNDARSLPELTALRARIVESLRENLPPGV